MASAAGGPASSIGATGEPQQATEDPAGSADGGQDDEDLGFPADVCPEALPDISRHHSVMADVLKHDPGMYRRLRSRRTRNGIGLAKCIKTGMDNRGHPMIKMLGVVAGDGECYDVFRDLFDAVIDHRLGPGSASAASNADVEPSELTSIRADDTGRYVLSTRIRAMRNLKGLPFPPAMSLPQLQDVERRLASAFAEMGGVLRGDYCPLEGSSSVGSILGSRPKHDELRRLGFLFDCPDSTVALCSGYGRHWPHGRGVFVNHLQDFAVWVNEAEHLHAMVVRPGDAAQHGLRELAEALDTIQASLARTGDAAAMGFEYSSRLGHLTSHPSNLGHALRISFVMSLPHLVAKGGLREWCAQRKLFLRSTTDPGGSQAAGMVEVSNAEGIGFSEVETVNAVIEAAAELAKAEQQLEVGDVGWEPAAVHGRVRRGSRNSLPKLAQVEELAELATQEQQFETGSAASDATLRPSLAASIGRGSTGTSPRSAANAYPTPVAAVEEPPPAADEPAEDAKPEVEDARDQLFSSLASASQSDALHGVLAACTRGRYIPSACGSPVGLDPAGCASRAKLAVDVEDVRSKFCSCLVSAARAGTLEGILTSASARAQPASSAAPEGDESVSAEALRELCRGTLLLSVEDGRLDQAFADCAAAMKEQNKVAAQRHASRGVLEKNISNGDVAHELRQPTGAREADVSGKGEAAGAVSASGKAASAAASSAGDDAGDGVRSRMRCALVSAMADGSLEGVLKGRAVGGILEAAASSAAGDAEAGDDVRFRMRDVLDAAMDDGSLEELFTGRAGLGILEEGAGAAGASGKAAPGSGKAASAAASSAGDDAGDDVRSRMRRSLVSAMADGSLENFFKGRAASGILEAAASSVGDAEAGDDVRFRMRDVLDAAMDDGSLEELFTGRAGLGILEEGAGAAAASGKAAPGGVKATSAAASSAGGDPSDDVRSRMRRSLVSAMADGSLEGFLKGRAASGILGAAASCAGNAEAGDDLRFRMRNVLDAAMDDGSLEELFTGRAGLGILEAGSGAAGASGKAAPDSGKAASAAASSAGDDAAGDDVRSRMRDVLDAAMDDGSLVELLNGHAVDSVRCSIKGVLEEALVDGSLFNMLSDARSVRGSLPAASSQPEETVHTRPVGFVDLRGRVREALECAMDDGSLEHLLEGTSEVGRVRRRVRGALEAALDDGMLDALMAASSPSNRREADPLALPAEIVDGPAQDRARDATEHAPESQEDHWTVQRSRILCMPSRPGRPSMPPSLSAVLMCDRKIGALTVAVREAARQLAEQNEIARQLEAEVVLARKDAELLGEEIKRTRMDLEDEEKRHFRLKASRRYLDASLLRQKSVGVIDPMLPFSARSDISTVCTVADIGPRSTYPVAPAQG